MAKINYWTPDKILATNARYMVVYGERSNGKTYGTLNYCLEEYFKNGSEFAYIRRWDDDLKGNKGGSIFNGLISNGVIKRLSKGQYLGVKYLNRSYYFIDKEGKASDKPFAYAFALTMSEHYKSNSYPEIRNIIFDEFLTRGMYLEDEFVIFQNVLSTLIRLRDDVKIFMLGNSVNKYAPYFKEMGLYKIPKQEKGTIDIYTYGNSGLRVAVEFSDSPAKNKKSNVYFAFNNPRLEMIKSGAFEIDIYPHYPLNYPHAKPKDIIFTFFIIFEGTTIQGDIIELRDCTIKDDEHNKEKPLPDIRFLFFHPRTKPLRENDNSLTYTQENNARPNYRKKLTKPSSVIERKIIAMFTRGKVFYSDNECGEVIRNYIIWCNS